MIVRVIVFFYYLNISRINLKKINGQKKKNKKYNPEHAPTLQSRNKTNSYRLPLTRA